MMAPVSAQAWTVAQGSQDFPGHNGDSLPAFDHLFDDHRPDSWAAIAVLPMIDAPMAHRPIFILMQIMAPR